MTSASVTETCLNITPDSTTLITSRISGIPFTILNPALTRVGASFFYLAHRDHGPDSDNYQLERVADSVHEPLNEFPRGCYLKRRFTETFTPLWHHVVVSIFIAGAVRHVGTNLDATLISLYLKAESTSRNISGFVSILSQIATEKLRFHHYLTKFVLARPNHIHFSCQGLIIL